MYGHHVGKYRCQGLPSLAQHLFKNHIGNFAISPEPGQDVLDLTQETLHNLPTRSGGARVELRGALNGSGSVRGEKDVGNRHELREANGGDPP